ncbi:MAG: hypothetical protein J7L38_02995 [Thermoproteales archaeon]|nr:hypothetical protein [Thermoproteales archaeon]
MFKAQNFIVAYGDKEYVVYAFSIDPAILKWPADSLNIVLKARHVKPVLLSEKPSSPYPTEPLSTS